MKRKQLLLTSMLLITAFGVLFTPLSRGSGAPAAAATAAAIELSSDSFLVDSLVTIRVYDVTAAGASFNVYFTYDLTGTDTLEAKTEYANITVHLGSNEDEWVYSMIFPAPTAGSYVRVHVCGTATGSTTDLASDTAFSQEFDDIFPTDLIVTVGVSLMVVLIIVGIVVGLAMLGSKKMRGG